MFFAVLDLRRLAATRDLVIVRDARGRSASPALEPHLYSPSLLTASGDFTVLQRFRVTSAAGREFALATRDHNPIHREADVVPGALTAARIILLPELLVRGFQPARFRIKFRAVSRYELPTVHCYRFRLPSRNQPAAAPGFEVTADVRQDGRTVAEAVLAGRIDPVLFSPAQTPGVLPSAQPAPAAPQSAAPAVESFLASLCIAPQPYLRWAGYAYPRAYLAALPSGEMVRQLSGEGGFLHSIDLNFSADTPLPPAHEPPPAVAIESQRRRGNSFRKIITRVFEGVRTYCQGIALVFAGSE